MNYYGNICLSDIPRECIREASNGKLYLNIRVVERRVEGTHGQTHFIAAQIKKEEQRDGVNYIFGDLIPSKPKVVTPQDILNAPAAPATTHLPWETTQNDDTF